MHPHGRGRGGDRCHARCARLISLPVIRFHGTFGGHRGPDGRGRDGRIWWWRYIWVSRSWSFWGRGLHINLRAAVMEPIGGDGKDEPIEGTGDCNPLTVAGRNIDAFAEQFAKRGAVVDVFLLEPGIKTGYLKCLLV